MYKIYIGLKFHIKNDVESLKSIQEHAKKISYIMN